MRILSQLVNDLYKIVAGGMVMTSSGQAQTVVTSMGTVIQSPMQTVHGQAVVASQQQVKLIKSRPNRSKTF